MAEDPDRGPARSTQGAALTVGGGLLLLGLSASVFLVLAARVTGPEKFAGLSVLWALLYTVGVGAFLPFEQEIARVLAHRGAHGEGGGNVVRRAGALAGALLAVLVVVALVAAVPLRALLGDSWVLLVALVVSCAALAGQYLTRGAFSGTGRFTPYAVQLGLEGLARLLGCLALIAADVSEPWPYAVVLAAAPVLSLVLTSGPLRHVLSRPGPPATLSDVSVNLGWLLGASLAAQGLANLATVAVKVLSSPSESAAAGQFLAGFTIARLPLFLFAALQAVLLPGLTRQLAQGRHRSFRRGLRNVFWVVAALGLAGVLGSLLLGPEVLGLLFGDEFSMERRDLTLLALSTAVYMLALVLQPAVIALGLHRHNALAWMSGLGVFGLGLLVPLATILRVELALIAGAATTVVVLLVALRGRVQRSDLPTAPDPAVLRLGME